MSVQSFISKEEINLLPEFNFTGEIVLVTQKEEALKALTYLSTFKELGFDTETRPAFKKGEQYNPDLIQIATSEKAYLFRLKSLGLIDELVALLEDESILKVGVAIKDDVHGLQRIRTFDPKGFVDIAKEARHQGIESQGLRALTGIFLGQRLMKGAKLTNWSRSELTMAQLQYAAFDAVASLLVFEKINELSHSNQIQKN